MKFSVVVTKMSLIICYYQNAALFSSDAHSYSPTRLTRLACCLCKITSANDMSAHDHMRQDHTL